MKKTKAFIIYGIIIVLCIAAFAGYLFSNKKSASTAQQSSKTATDSTSTAHKPRLSVDDKLKLSAMKPDANPVVGVYQGTDHSKVTRQAIENSGKLKEIIKKGDVVLIKPNLGAFGIAGESPDDTDYRVVQEIANIAREYGASRVIVGEGSYSGNVFKELGYNKITGVELVDFNELNTDGCYKLEPINGLTGQSFYIPKIYMDADVVISAAKLKTYSEVTATLSLKNVFGVPPANLYGSIGGKTDLHYLGVENSIVDLNKIRKPDFAVIDGIIGGKGPGPAGNKPVKSNIIFAGNDLVAVDTAALTFMGFSLDEVGHVKLAGEQNLGISDINAIKVKGADLNSIKMNFKYN